MQFLALLAAPLFHQQTWGAVVLATSPPLPTKESLEVKIGGTSDLGVLAREGPLSPRVAKKPPPLASPVCCSDYEGGQVTPLRLECRRWGAGD